jgi:glutamate decarboxylase
MPHHDRQDPHAGADLAVNPLYTRGALHHSVPRLRMPDDETDADTAASIVRDELLLDGSARLNLATFVTTWMEPAAAALMADTLDKNMIDKDEYPQTAELERRCVFMLAELWHADTRHQATGCSTTGSSEAAMLAGMALKWRWREAARAAGHPTDRPNLVMGINVQVCWEKFCRYWDVEPRYVPMEPGRLHLTAPEAVALCDENTIGVVAIMGSTQDGSYEPVADICAALDALHAQGGPDVPVHVDAASGGFVAPFLQPELVWDFQLPRVASINASGHKYGLVYPGVGWVLWRDRDALPADLVFHVNYLGGSMPTFALNFSRPGAQVVAQYYQFLRLGREGFRLTDAVTTYTVFDVSDALRKRGWQLPAYTFPANLTHLAVLRAVIRNGFTRDLADLLLADLRRELAALERQPPAPSGHLQRAHFHH